MNFTSALDLNSTKLASMEPTKIEIQVLQLSKKAGGYLFKFRTDNLKKSNSGLLLYSMGMFVFVWAYVYFACFW